MRIISTVPSITETLFDFDLDRTEIVGRTKFCIHPTEKVFEIETVGGTKNLNLDKIKSLRPDLIIANKEENQKDQIEALMQDFNVWVTDIETLEDNEKFLTELGGKLHKQDLAEKFNSEISNIFKNLNTEKRKKAAYLIWNNPYMTIGSDTFIHHILNKIGFDNIYGNQKRYPKIDTEDLKNAEYILLSTEPYPFKEKHKNEFETLFPNSKIMIVDGEAFSWYGTHLTKVKNYLSELAQIN